MRISINRGLTLIEVIASLILAATVVSSLLLAINRSLVQQKTTQRQTQAAGLGQELILRWSVSLKPHAQREEGTFEQAPNFRWVRTQEQSSLADVHRLIEITLHVLAEGESSNPLASYTWLEPLRELPIEPNP